MAGELRRLGTVRGPSAAEDFQLEMLENLVKALRVALPQERNQPFMRDCLLPVLHALCQEAEAATSHGIPAPDLLGLQGAIPRGPRWRPFRLTPESLGWLGVVLISDALRVCQRATAAPQRGRQLAALLDFQDAISAAVEVDPDSPRFVEVRGRLLAPYVAAAAAVGDQVPTILAEASAVADRATAVAFLAGWAVSREEPRQ